MSDNWICIIPKDPVWVPVSEIIGKIKQELRTICPDSEDVEFEVDEKVQFRDCGGNFETVNCPGCGAELIVEEWQKIMDEDYRDDGFQLNKYKLACCCKEFTLNELTYYFNQGFSKCIVSAMNPNKGELSNEEIGRMKTIFSVDITVIYQHI